MIRSRELLLVTLLTLYFPSAFGLGLGELEVTSSLNQTLKATIMLTDTSTLPPGEIDASLASVEDFNRFDLERLNSLTNLIFTVRENSRRELYLDIRSTKPIREPLFDLVVEVLWPSGKLLSEYTIFLDLPIFDNQDVAPVELAIATEKITRGERAELIKTEQTMKSSASRNDRQDVEVEFGITKSGDTLWGIALKVRTNKTVSVQQTMLALQRLNPDAFINNNINLLKAGYVLRIPYSPDMIKDSKANSISQVKLQNQQFQEYKLNRMSQLDATQRQRSEVFRATNVRDGELRLLAANLSSGQRAGAVGFQDSELQNELDFTREELDGARRSNSELNMRLDDLTSQIETLNELVKLKDDQLATWRLEMQKLNELVKITSAEKKGAFFKDPIFVSLLVIILVSGIVIGILLIQRRTGRNNLDDADLSVFSQENGIDWVEDSNRIKNNADEREVLTGATPVASEADFVDDINQSIGDPNIDEDANGKLNLARAYVDMNDEANARPLLNAVLDEGNMEQVQEANMLLERLD